MIGVDFQAQRRTADIDRDLTYANLASDVVGLLDHLGIERAHVIGHSMGGGTALELAVNHPDRLLSVVRSPPACAPRARTRTWPTPAPTPPPPGCRPSRTSPRWLRPTRRWPPTRSASTTCSMVTSSAQRCSTLELSPDALFASVDLGPRGNRRHPPHDPRREHISASPPAQNKSASSCDSATSSGEPTDRPAKLIYPTPRGRRLLDRAGNGVAEIEAPRRRLCPEQRFDQALPVAAHGYRRPRDDVGPAPRRARWRHHDRH